ncbi:MAG: hypothetical protein RL422_487 [Bacteroidota bacterium]
MWPRRESSRARPRPSLAFRRCALLLPSRWPRRESSRARPRPSLAFRRCALLLPSGWPRRESNPDLAFRKRLFYPLNYSANLFYSLCFMLYAFQSYCSGVYPSLCPIKWLPSSQFGKICICLSFNIPMIVSRNSARLLRCSAEMKTVLGVLVFQ